MLRARLATTAYRGRLVATAIRGRLVATALAVVSLAFIPGCITLFSKTEVVRGEESRRPVRFENAQAADDFHWAMKFKTKASMGGAHVGVPFVTLYSRDRQLSDAAHFNDCVSRCDTDQDGVITQAEAKMFREMKD